MLESLAALFIVLWLVGLISSNTIGGFIYILLVLAAVIVLFHVMQGKKVL